MSTSLRARLPLVITLLLLTFARQAAASPDEPLGASSVSVRAGLMHTALGREGRVLLSLSFPLGAFARGAPEPARVRGLQQATPDERAGAPGAQSSAELTDAGSGGEASAAGAESDALPRALRLSSADVSRLVKHALAADRASSRERRLHRLASRSKSSAWLPELSLRGGRRSDQTLRLTPTASDPYRYSQSDGSDLYGEARLRWKLDHLLFTKEEVVLARQHQSEQQRRDQVVERLLTALFAWQRAELARRDPLLSPEVRLRHRLEALQARLRLDVLTGGGFSRLVPDGARRRRVP